MGLKRDFIEAVRLTPEGIDAFLVTPIPDAPEITTPEDVDAATIAAGVLSKYLLDFFGAFSGLTIVELLLRIGQHNTVLESAMLAGLEYIEGADTESNLVTIQEPSEGGSYLPGEMRFSASVSNGVCVGMALVLSGGSPVKMVEKDGVWQQFVNVDIGALSATVTATFEDGSDAEASVSCTVEEEDPELPPEEQPQPPGGTDDTALKTGREKVKLAYRDLIKFVTIPDVSGTVQAASDFNEAVVAFVQMCADPSSFVTALKTAIASDLQRLLVEVTDGDMNEIKSVSSAIMDKINTLYVGLTQ